MANGNGNPATVGQIKTAGILMAVIAALLGALNAVSLMVLTDLRSDITSMRVQLSNTNSVVFENQRAIAVMQGNKFTSQDGLDIWREIGQIRTDLAGKADK